jgi:hypothetical protein
MTTRDLYNNVKVVQALAPAVINADTTSSAIDLQGYESTTILVDVGNSADTLSGTNKIELELTECDTSGGSYTQVAAANLQGAVTGSNTGCFGLIDDPAEDTTVFKAGYIGSKQFLKVVVNFSGTHSTGTPIGVLAVKSHAHLKPVS